MPSPKQTILDRGLKPKKSFGQNFMVDQRINSIFADAVDARKARRGEDDERYSAQPLRAVRGCHGDL